MVHIEDTDWWTERKEEIAKEIWEIELRIDELRARRAVLVVARDNIRAKLKVPKGDSEYLPTSVVLPYIEQFYNEYGQGAMQLLAEKTGIDLKRLRNIRYGQVLRLTFTEADKIMTVLGIGHLLD